jgi:WD40 repeat protein
MFSLTAVGTCCLAVVWSEPQLCSSDRKQQVSLKDVVTAPMGNQPSIHAFPHLKLSQVCQLPESDEQQLVLSPTGDRIALLPYRPRHGSAFYVYKTSDLSLLSSFGKEEHQKLFKPCGAVWTKQDEIIVSSKDPTRLSIWSIEKRTYVRDVSLEGSGITILNALEISPNGKTLYIAGYHQDDQEWLKGSLFTLDLETLKFARYCAGKMMDVFQMCLRPLPPSPLIDQDIFALHCMMRAAKVVGSVSILQNYDGEKEFYQCFPIPERLKEYEVRSVTADENNKYFFLSGHKGAILRGVSGLAAGTVDQSEDRPILSEKEGDKLCIFSLKYADKKLVCLCYETGKGGEKWQLLVFDVEEEDGAETSPQKEEELGDNEKNVGDNDKKRNWEEDDQGTHGKETKISKDEEQQ